MVLRDGWSEEDNALLRELWTLGHSCAEIGRRMHRSKNSVVGRAHRLDLESRPSPIRGHVPKSNLPTVPSIPRRVHTLPPLTSEVPQPAPEPEPTPTPAPFRMVTVVPAPKTAAIELFRTIAAVPLKVVQEAPAVPVAKPIAKPRKTATCCWPIGEPGKAGFHFCDHASVANKPYCEEHCSKAYVRTHDRREDATV